MVKQLIPRGFWLIPILAITLLILLGGGTIIFGLIKLFTSPITTGNIPVWAIFVVVALYLWWTRR